MNIKYLFWNGEENRVRSLWRVLIQLLLTLFLIFVISTIVVNLLIMAGISPKFMNTAPGDTIIYFFTLVSTVLSVWFVGTKLDKRPFYEFGFDINKDWWLDFIFGFVLGIFLMGIIFIIELKAGWIEIKNSVFQGIGSGTSASVLTGIFLNLIFFIMVGIEEELLSRGYQLLNLSEGFNYKKSHPVGAIILATLVTSGFFSILHAGNPNVTAVSLINIFLAGIFLATGFVLTGQLAIPIGLHISWNFFQGNVFGFPVSGMNRQASLITIQQKGPELWTGGAFGPEAGLLGVLATLLGILLIVGWVVFRYKKAGICTGLAEYNHIKEV
ncbi:CPBP family intramembrane glutamic endopeptidase [Halothermothrix orenii]|uniref:Abortive infection protein n=1 Tax=Halothermothrix orenii (strain H 168 / OCM 544 / DSM 9562) TaxID=373903 RepID=B8CXQ4_HALOH|nr:type II CAAX endopeptidase family protein [Halothermothrix orenii]ACL70073.1 Abortive infection protein [Halothermothrix orenii H 168]